MDIQTGQIYSYKQLGRRANQEDARWPDCDRPSDLKPLFIVCDGVGGEEAGEVAATTVAQTMGTLGQRFDYSHKFGQHELRSLLRTAYQALDKVDVASCGTTLTLVALHSGGAYCAHIGDSRIYHIRPGIGIFYRSQDHSLVQALVHNGDITPEEAIAHPQSNVITRCMSPVAARRGRAAATAVNITDIQEGDYILLMSDGALHGLPDQRLMEIVDSAIPDSEKIAVMAQTTAASSDNNTVILIPIKHVVGADLENTENYSNSVSCPTEVDVEQSFATKPINQRSDTACDVSADSSSQSFASRLKNLLSDLF